MKDWHGKIHYPTHKENLTNEETFSLIQFIQKGKQEGTTDTQEWRDAYLKLIEYNYPAVIKYASRYHYKWLGNVIQSEDMYQAAMEMLCQCAYTYDSDHFGAYLKHSIQYALIGEKSAFTFPSVALASFLYSSNFTVPSLL